MRAAKMVDSTAPALSIAGPPELPCSTVPETAVIVRVTGPLPYASSVRTAAVFPIRLGTTSSGPFSG